MSTSYRDKIIPSSIRHVHDSRRYYRARTKDGKDIFLKIEASEKDFSLEREYLNGLQTNTLEINEFLPTYSYEVLPERFFPLLRLKGERKVLITEFDPSPTFMDLLQTFRLGFHKKNYIFRQTAKILIWAYNKIGFVHGDLRPGNIIVNGNRCIIYDFGRSFFLPYSSNDIVEEENRRQVFNDLSTLAKIIFFKNDREIMKKYINFFERDFVINNHPTEVIASRLDRL